MSLRKVTSLGSNLVSVTDLKRTPHSLWCGFGGNKTYITRWSCGRVQVWDFESKFEPLPVIWQSSRRLFQKVIKGLEGKINDQPLQVGAALRHCLGGSDGRAQRQGLTGWGRFRVGGSPTVAPGRDRLAGAWEKYATTLAILTQFKSQQGINAL